MIKWSACAELWLLQDVLLRILSTIYSTSWRFGTLILLINQLLVSLKTPLVDISLEWLWIAICLGAKFMIDFLLTMMQAGFIICSKHTASFLANLIHLFVILQRLLASICGRCCTKRDLFLLLRFWRTTPLKTNMTGWKIHHEWVLMYFLCFNMGLFQLVMWSWTQGCNICFQVLKIWTSPPPSKSPEEGL